jgi:hypothetical protein
VKGFTDTVESFAVHCNALNPADDVSVTTWKLIMKQSVNFSAFVDAFHAHNRYDSFGYDGLRVIFDYLESYEEDTGEEIELDVIAICCDYSMMTIEEIVSGYEIDLTDVAADDVEEFVLSYLNETTNIVGKCADGVIFQCF